MDPLAPDPLTILLELLLHIIGMLIENSLNVSSAALLVEFMISYPDLVYHLLRSNSNITLSLVSYILKLLGKPVLTRLTLFLDAVLEQYWPDFSTWINNISPSWEFKSVLYFILMCILVSWIKQNINFGPKYSKFIKQSLKNKKSYVASLLGNTISNLEYTVLPATVDFSGPGRSMESRLDSFGGHEAHMHGLSAIILARHGFYCDHGDNTVICWWCRAHLQPECNDPARDSHAGNCPYLSDNPEAVIRGHCRQSRRDQQDVPVHWPPLPPPAPRVQEVTDRPAAAVTDPTIADNTNDNSSPASTTQQSPQATADEEDNQAVGGASGVSDIHVNIPPRPRTNPKQP